MRNRKEETVLSSVWSSRLANRPERMKCHNAVSFAMTIHGLMDYELDQSNGQCSYETDKNLLDDYLKWFCEENAV